ncbi:MAG: GAF domain-containing protein [Chloroflexi bacterium]|nr:GAF domain-containing protein [Chloroflexota bacterium]
MSLWPRLVIAVTVGFLVLFGVFSLLAMRAVNDSTQRVLEERLVIAQMGARELDRLLERAFYELEKATGFASFDPEAPSLVEEYHMLAHAYGRVGTLSLGVYFLDRQGHVVLSEPPEALLRGVDLSEEAHIRQVMDTLRRSVSYPFVEPATRRPAVALTVPVLNPDGTLRAMLSGLVDASSAEVLGPLQHARDLGHTGHAELIGSRGLVIASTDYGAFLRPGEHLEFYLRMARQRGPAVENTPYNPWHPVPEGREREHHVMAFAPLASAPWGMAVGGTDWDTFAPVNRLRNNLLLGGGLALALLWGLTLMGARALVRPVETLTRVAGGMASGDLEQPVRVGEGGEIGVLAESLEAMRTQLKESMDRLKQWGEELEDRVQERTAELSLSNRRLAAVTAVATAANEVPDLCAMLERCLEAVLDQTRMEAAALRLLHGTDGQLAVAASRGSYRDFPCQDGAVALGECPCGVVAASGRPLYLDAEERLAFRPPCRGPESQALAVLPLTSPKGTLGVLYLSRGGGAALGEEERQTLEAICHQLAVAVENTRLLEELRQLEARREMERLKAEFMSAVSHELRTPLGLIKGYTTTLQREDVAIEQPTQRQFLQVIAEETVKLQRMIDELLDASRLQAGRLPLEKQAVALGALVRQGLDRFRATLEQEEHAFADHVPQEPLVVVADPLRVEQVLHNLLDNAVTYSSPGSSIEVRVVREDGYGLVSVADQGEGIPEAERERMFEPFFRGENARRRSVRGTGLGLAICRGIVEAHGGRMWLESAPGRGNTFFFTLPSEDADGKAPEP